MTDCEYCHKEIKKDDDFILVGKYPSAWDQIFVPALVRKGFMPEDFGTIYHKTCFLEMMNNEVQK